MGDEQHGQADGVVTGVDAMTSAARVEELEQELLKARQAALVSRDHLVGIEAEIGRQNAEILRLNVELRRATARAKRLSQRKRSQARRITALEPRRATARQRTVARPGRVRDLEPPPARPPLARRVVRGLRGPRR